MSCEMSTPTTWAEYFCERPCTVTVMLVDWLTTWLLVRISPVELMIMPVPAAWLDPTVVLMSTIAGSTFAAIALAVPLPSDGVVPGVAAGMGGSRVVGAWAAGRLFTTGDRLLPVP